MSAKEPSDKELKRAVRFLRHVANCNTCHHNFNANLCNVGYAHFWRWDDIYYEEIRGEK